MLLVALLAQAKPHVVLPKSRPEANALIYGRKEEPDYDRLVLGRGALSGVGDLRGRLLPPNGAEFRLWEGFGPSYTTAWIFQRTGGRWRATRLLPALPRYRARHYRWDRLRPKAGWPTFWRRLNEYGAWTLPDQEDVITKREPGTIVLDGIAYFVETQRGGVYRAYLYDNPEPEHSPQASRFLRMKRYIAAQFPPDPDGLERVRERLKESSDADAKRRNSGSGQIRLPSGAEAAGRSRA